MRISEINIYPIKSLKGIGLDAAVVEERGLQYDRRWMLVDENDDFLTQRKFPVMATIAVSVADGGLSVSHGGDVLIIPPEPEKPRIAHVKIWRNRCRAHAYDDVVNTWFSDILGAKVRLVHMPDSTRRLAHAPYRVRPDDHVSFADGYPFLLIGEGSLTELNGRLETPLPMTRFRPNFVVSGSAAFAEDTWKRIRIGDTIFHVVKPCARCVITTTDQVTGARISNEPLKTLATFRTRKIGKKSKILFGQNLIAETPGAHIAVGDAVAAI